MRTAKLAGAVLASGLIGAVGVGAFTATALPLPAPQDPRAAPAPAGPAAPGGPPPLEADWVTKTLPPPTAFPDILPAKGPGDQSAYPAIYGAVSLKVVPTDSTHRRLLKAQLHQYREYLARAQTRLETGQFTSGDIAAIVDACERMQAVAAELWQAERQVLDAWLVDLVRLAKSMEEFTQARVRTGTDPPHVGNFVAAQRLGLEAALWKHRNPGRGR